MPKKILFIAAGFLQTFLIKKAKELGYYVVAIDGNPNAEGFQWADEAYCVDITKPQACIDFVKDKHFDGVITAASDYGVISASDVAHFLKLPGLNPEIARLIKNKFQVRKRLFENHVDDTGQSFEVDENTDLKELTYKITLPVMVKPCDGSGSRGASKVENVSELKQACEFAINSSLSRKAVVEPFIEGKEYGVESLVHNGAIHVLAVMEKKMTNPPFYAELGHAIPSSLPLEIEQYVKDVVAKALKALGVNHGSVNMDLLISDDGKVHIVDVGARMGGNLIGSHIIPLATGFKYMENIIKGAVGDPLDFENDEPMVVVTRLLALTPGKVKSLPDFDEISEKYNVIIEHRLKVGDIINPYRTNLDGCGYIVATGTDKEETKKRAEAVLDLIDRNIIRE